MRNDWFARPRVIVTTIGLAFGLALSAGQALAMKSLDGEVLRTLIAGNTFSGQMIDGTSYRVFYDFSGTARAGTAKGSWTVKDERLCAIFEGNGQICLAISLKNREVLWVSPYGELEGTGEILKGNPYKF